MENERLDWLKSIYPEFEDKASLYGNVYRRTDLTYFHFFNKSRTFRGYIDPENIVGIDYGFAYNFDTVINWHELFIRLRRFRQIQGFKTKNELFNHVHSDYNEEKCVYKYGNHFFTYQGQHRLCLAKFLNIEKVQVEITEFELDKSWLIRFRKLKKATEKLLKKSMCGEYSFKDLIEASKSEYFYLNLLNCSFRIKIDVLLQFIEYYEKCFVCVPLYRLQYFLYKLLYPVPIYEIIEINHVEDFKKANSAIIKHKMKNTLKV